MYTTGTLRKPFIDRCCTCVSKHSYICVSGHVTTLLGYTSLKSMCWPRELEVVCQIVVPHEKANTGHETNLIIVRRNTRTSITSSKSSLIFTVRHSSWAVDMILKTWRNNMTMHDLATTTDQPERMNLAMTQPLL